MVSSVHCCCIVVERFAGVFFHFTRSLVDEMFQFVNCTMGFESSKGSTLEANFQTTKKILNADLLLDGLFR